MKLLRHSVGTGNAFKFSNPMVYRMVSSLAKFHPDYRSVDEIILDSSNMEASSQVSFAKVKQEGSFHTHPALIDALSQSAGFVMNANDSSNLEEEVFVNHGWKNFQLFERVSDDKHYDTYVKMVESDRNTWVGDVLVFDGPKIVATFGGMTVSYLLHSTNVCLVLMYDPVPRCLKESTPVHSFQRRTRCI